MEFDEYSEQIRKLGDRYVEEGTRTWQRFSEAVGKTSAVDWDVERNSRKFTRFAQGEGTEYMRRLMQLNMEHYISLVNAGLDFSNRLVDSMLQPVAECGNGGAESSGAAEDSGKATDILFAGKTGDIQGQSFVVSNRQSADVEVSFEVSEFVSEDGSSRVHVPVEFEPEQFVLGAGKEQIVECRVTFDPELAAGQRHQALARVVGFPDMILRLLLKID